MASSATAFYLQLFLLDVAQVSVGSSPGPRSPLPWCLVSLPPTNLNTCDLSLTKGEKTNKIEQMLLRPTSSRMFIAGCLQWKVGNNVVHNLHYIHIMDS